MKGAWFFFLILLPAANAAEWGAIDRAFNAQIPPIFGQVDQLESFADGRVAIAGAFHKVGGETRDGVALVSADGTVSQQDVGVGFGYRGQVFVRADGTFWTWGGRNSRWKPWIYQREYNPDGTLVPGPSDFPISGVPTGANHPDGSTTMEWGSGFARFDTNGTTIGLIPDTNSSFQQITPLAGLADGAVLVKGAEYPPVWPLGGGEPTPGLRILETNGTINPGFKVDGLVGQGKTFASTNCFFFDLTTVSSSRSSSRLFRVENRTIDTTFVSPFSTNSVFAGIAALDDGGAIVAGGLADTNGAILSAIVRLDRNGALIPAFTDKLGFVLGVSGLAKGPSNTWYVAVWESLFSSAIRKFGADGAFYPEFRVLIEQCPRITSALEQPDQHLALGSDFLPTVGGSHTGFVTLNPDGSPDDRSYPILGQVLELDPYPGEGMVQLGQLGNRRSIVRAETNGAPVTGFACPFGFITSFNTTAGANQLSVSPDGKILVSSSLSLSLENGQLTVGTSPIARLLANGSVDPTFINPTNTFATNSTADCHYLLKDGRILLSGDLQSVDGQILGKVVRLDSNGSLDPTFKENTSDSRPVIIAGETRAGQIVIWSLGAGSSSAVLPVRRILGSGALDWSFHAKLSSTSTVTAVTLQRDDRILVAGTLFDTNGLGLPKIIRLEPDGALDATFEFDGQVEGDIERLTLLRNGDILAMGSFDLDSETRSIIRLRSAEQPQLTSNRFDETGPELSLIGNSGQRYVIEQSTTLSNWTEIGSISIGDTTNAQSFHLPAGEPFAAFRARLAPE